MRELRKIEIKGIDENVLSNAQKRVDELIKPKGSLGKMEELYVKLSGILGTTVPDISKKAIVVFAADHGIFEEGIAVTPREVTAIQAVNMTKGLTGVCAFAKCAGAEVKVVDMGIDAEIECDAIYHSKLMPHGTDNMTKGPAMPRDIAIRAVEKGRDMARLAYDEGVRVLGVGEMGIGNTTPSAAIVSVIGGYEPAEVTGIGANLPVSQVPKKIDVIKRAIEINKPDPMDGVDVLSKVGGLDIGGMAGLIIGAAEVGIPVVIDGFISYAAAMVAFTIEPGIKPYIITSHCSKEKGALKALEWLEMGYHLDLDLRLGEGTGAAIMFTILDHALAMSRYMPTFEEAGFRVD